MWQYWARVLGAVGIGRMAVAERHMVVLLGVDHVVAHPSQPAPRPGQGWTAVAQRHIVVVMRVEHPVAHPSQPAPRPGQGGLLSLRGTQWLCRGLSTPWRARVNRRHGRDRGGLLRLKGTQGLCKRFTTLRAGSDGCSQGRDGLGTPPFLGFFYSYTL